MAGSGTTVEIIGLNDSVDDHEEHSVAHEIAMGVTRVVGGFPSLADADIDVVIEVTADEDADADDSNVNGGD